MNAWLNRLFLHHRLRVLHCIFYIFMANELANEVCIRVYALHHYVIKLNAMQTITYGKTSLFHSLISQIL